MVDHQKKLRERINRMLRDGKPHIIAIDGRCASGKTTLAAALQRDYGCDVIAMDHFFLRPEQRTAERLRIPGENVDHERFLQEVLLPLKQGKPISYRPFDCSRMELSNLVETGTHQLTIVEGSYSCHPNLWAYYDLRLFLTVNPEEQLRRLIARNGSYAQVFREKWIPLEEAYFSAWDLPNCCDLCIHTD